MNKSTKNTAPDSAVQAIHASTIEDSLVTPDHMYIDLELAKDYRLGCMLSFLDERPTADAAKAYQVIKQNLYNYQLRKYHETEPYFFDLGITDSMIETRLYDPAYADQIFARSPNTYFLECLKAQMAINVNHSQVKEKFKRIQLSKGKYRREYDDVTFYVNTYPLQLSSSVRDLVGRFFTDNYRVTTVVLCQDIRQASVSMITAFDEMYVIHLGRLLDNKMINKALSDMQLKSRRIFAPMMFDRHRKTTHAKAYEAEVNFLKVFLGVLCTFEWIPNAHFAIDLSLYPDPVAV